MAFEKLGLGISLIMLYYSTLHINKSSNAKINAKDEID